VELIIIPLTGDFRGGGGETGTGGVIRKNLKHFTRWVEGKL